MKAKYTSTSSAKRSSFFHGPRLKCILFNIARNEMVEKAYRYRFYPDAEQNEWPPFNGRTLFGDTRPTAKPISPIDQTTPILFITGPEKGFTPAEITTLENTLHASGVRLHTNILRMETAPLVALCSLTSPQNH